MVGIPKLVKIVFLWFKVSVLIAPDKRLIAALESLDSGPANQLASQTAEPMPSSGSPIPPIDKPISSVVKQVPMFVPRITPSVLEKLSIPALTRPIEITVIAVLLCSSAVNAVPVNKPRAGVRVNRSNQI
jgi:hypothetical protein